MTLEDALKEIESNKARETEYLSKIEKLEGDINQMTNLYNTEKEHKEKLFTMLMSSGTQPPKDEQTVEKLDYGKIKLK